MHGAAKRGADSITKYLVENGANVNAHNKRGFTALDLAMGKGGYNGAPGPAHDASAAIIRQVANPAKRSMRPPKPSSLPKLSKLNTLVKLLTMVREDRIQGIDQILRQVLREALQTH